jgi:DNA-binding NarL/FixJ family response regulator
VGLEQGFSVYIADDPISIIGLSQLFEGRVLGSASDGAKALQDLISDAPTVAILSACLPGLSGSQIVRKLHESECEAAPVLISCSCHTIDFVEAIANGLMGFATRSPKTIFDVVKQVARGETALGEAHSQLVGGLRKAGTPCKLTPREREVLVLVADGFTTKRISGEIFIAEPTIKFHLRNIYSKLDVHNKGAAVSVALRQGLID